MNNLDRGDVSGLALLRVSFVAGMIVALGQIPTGSSNSIVLGAWDQLRTNENRRTINDLQAAGDSVRRSEGIV